MALKTNLVDIATGKSLVDTADLPTSADSPVIRTRPASFLGDSANINLAEIVGNGASQLALAANPNRTHAVITNINTSTTSVWLGLGVAAAANQGIRLGPGCSLVLDDDWRYLGAIYFWGAMTATIARWEA